MVKIQDRLNPREQDFLLRNKLAFHRRCVENGLAVPRLLAVIDTSEAGKAQCPNDAEFVDGERALERFLAAQPGGSKIIIKPVAGVYGFGVMALTIGPDGAVDQHGKPVTARDIWAARERVERQTRANYAKTLRRRQRTRWLKKPRYTLDYYAYYEALAGCLMVQQCLAVHSHLKQVMAGKGVGTIRIISLLSDDTVTIPFAWMKLPRGDNLSDNFQHGKSGNLISQIDMETGRLVRVKGPTENGIAEIAAHPDTGVSFAGFEIPCWHEALDLVKRSAGAFREQRSIGWDVVIGDSGPVLLEGNHHWDHDAIEVLRARGIKDEVLAWG